MKPEEIAHIIRQYKGITKNADGDIIFPLTPHNVELRNRIVEDNIRLVNFAVQNIPKKFSQDAEQNGFLGLIRAAETFDPSTGVSFGSYAYKCIKSKIGREREIHRTTVRVPHATQNKHRSYKRVEAILAGRLFRKPFPEEISEFLIKERKHSTQHWTLQEAKNVSKEKDSGSIRIDSPAFIHHERQLAAPINQPVIEDIIKNEQLANMRKKLMKLDKVARKVVTMRFLENAKFEEIGLAFNFTKQRAQQILVKALQEMQVSMGVSLPEQEKVALAAC